MISKQVDIDENLERALKALAARTGESEAALVRAALRAYLEAYAPTSREPEPLLGIIGLVGDSHGADDAADEHDHYLYGAPKGQ